MVSNCLNSKLMAHDVNNQLDREIKYMITSVNL